MKMQDIVGALVDLTDLITGAYKIGKEYQGFRAAASMDETEVSKFNSDVQMLADKYDITLVD